MSQDRDLMKEAEDQGLLPRARNLSKSWRLGAPWETFLFEGAKGLYVLYWMNPHGHGINVFCYE